MFVVELLDVGHTWMKCRHKCGAVGLGLMTGRIEEGESVKGGNFLKDRFDERGRVGTGKEIGQEFFESSLKELIRGTDAT